MRHFYRFVGFLVVVLIIASLAMYTLNSFGYIRGPLSRWINDVANHCQGVVNDTKEFMDDQGIVIPILTAAPQSNAQPSAEPDSTENAPKLTFSAP